MRSKVLHFALTVVVATVLGPFIGGMGFLAASVAIEIAQSQFDISELGAMFRFFLLGAYVVGGIIALLAGILVAGLALWRSPTLPMILAAAAASNLICFLALQLGLSYGSAGFLANVAASLFATTICWAIFRPHIRRA